MDFESFYAQGQSRRCRDRGAAGGDRAPGVRAGGQGDSALLLSRAARHRRQLPDVPRRGEAGAAQAAGELRAAGGRQSGDLHQHARRPQGARGGDGVPAHQPSARLPDLRPGRRMRPPGPGDRLRPRPQSLRREQARGHREIYGARGQDDHDALHPLHALRPLHGAGRWRRGDRRGRARREYGDHLLSRACSVERAFGQCRRSLPGRRPRLQALQLRGAALGAAQGARDRRHGRARHQHPPRRARPRGDARAPPPQRGRQRGMGVGQDPPCGRRPDQEPARPALAARKRQAASGDAGTRPSPAIAEVAEKAEASVAAVAGDLVDVETMYAARQLLASLGSDLLEGRQTGLAYDTTNLAAVNFNTTIAGIETADVDPPRRHQSALGGASGQHPHPQGGEGRGQGVRDRARNRPHLSRSPGSATICRCSPSFPTRSR